MRNKKGFTLTELIVVVAIIVILAGAAAFGIARTIQNSKKTQSAEAEHNEFENDMVSELYDLQGKDFGLSTITPKPTSTTMPSPTTNLNPTSAPTATTAPTSAGGGATVTPTTAQDNPGGGDGGDESTEAGSGSTSKSATLPAGEWYVQVGTGSYSSIPENAKSITITITGLPSNATQVQFAGMVLTISGTTATGATTSSDTIRNIVHGWNSAVQVNTNGKTTSCSISVKIDYIA